MSKISIQFLISLLSLCCSVCLTGQSSPDVCLDDLPSNVPTFDDEGCSYCGGCGNMSFDIPEIEDGNVIGDTYNTDQDNMIFGLLSHDEIIQDVLSQGDDIPFSPQTVLGIGEYIDQSIDVRALLDCVNLNCENNPFLADHGIDFESLFLEIFNNEINANGGFTEEDIEGLQSTTGDFLSQLNSLSQSDILGADINQQVFNQIPTGCIVNGEIDFNCLVEAGLGLSSYPDEACEIDTFSLTSSTSVTSRVKSTGSIQDEGEIDLFSTRIPGTALNVPNEITPGPSAMAQMNANTQVNLYNGSLATSLPLHTLTANDLSVPVSLSMNGTGLKIDDMGTEVGNNWSLNAGGQISRVVKNLPDEYFGEREVGRGRGPTSTLKPCIGLDLGRFAIGLRGKKKFEWRPTAPNEFRYHVKVFQGAITIGPIVIPYQIYVTIVVKLNVRMKPDYYTLTEKGLGSLHFLDADRVREVASSDVVPTLENFLAIPNQSPYSAGPAATNKLLRIANGKSRFEDQTFLSSTLGVLANFFNGVENLFGEVNKTYTNIDLQRDQFSYNFPGYSGEFIIYAKREDDTGSYGMDVISKPANNLKIDVGSIVEVDVNGEIQHQLSGFTVLTPEGVEYTFGDPKENAQSATSLQGVEYSQSTTYNLPNYITYPKKPGIKGRFGPATLDQSALPYESSLLCLPRALMYGSTYENLYTVQRSSKYISSWKLTKIRSLMSQEVITLAYATINNLKYHSSKTLTHKFPNFEAISDDVYPFKSPANPHANPFGANEYIDQKGEFTYSVVEMALDKQRLEGIYSDRLEDVIFEYGQERPDLPGDQLLNLVKINRSDQFYRAYELSYDLTDGSLEFECEQPQESPVALPVSEDGWTFRFNDPHTKWFDGMLTVRFKRFDFVLFGKTISLNFPWPKPSFPRKEGHVGLLNEYGSLLYVKGLEHPQRTVTPELIEQEEKLYNAEMNRSLLRSVSVIGNQGGSLPYADLEYYGKLSQLPKRFSVKQDVWGYYNSENASLFPAIRYTDTAGNGVEITNTSTDAAGVSVVNPNLKHHYGFLQGLSQNEDFYQGQKRTTTLGDAQIGALQRVILPTGGNISYTFELNDVPNPDGTVAQQSGAGIRVKTKTESAGSDGPEKLTTYEYSGATVTNHPMKVVHERFQLSDYDVTYCPFSIITGGVDVLDYISNDESLDVPVCTDVDLATVVTSASYPLNGWLMNGSGYVGYNIVEEVLATETVDLGKVKHEFITPVDYPAIKFDGFRTSYATNNLLGIGDSYPSYNYATFDPWYATYIPYDQRYGLEKATLAYDKEGSLVSNIVNTYEFSSELHLVGKHVKLYEQRFPGNFLLDIVLREAFSFQSPGSQTTGEEIIQILQSTAQEVFLPHPYKKIFRHSWIKDDPFFIDYPRLKKSESTTFFADGSSHSAVTENTYKLAGEKYRLIRNETYFRNEVGNQIQSTGNRYVYLNDFPAELSASFDQSARNYLSTFGLAGLGSPIQTFTLVNGTNIEGQMTSFRIRPTMTGSGTQILPLANWSLINGAWQLTNYNTAWHSSTLPIESQAAEHTDEPSFDPANHTFYGKRNITLNGNLLPLDVTVQEDGGNGSFSKEYTYSPYYQELKTSTDPNGVISTFSFDEFGRLETQVSGNNRTTTSYRYSLNPTNLSTQISYADGTPSQGVVKHFNGLGMPTHTERHDGAELSVIVYDDFFRVSSQKTIGKAVTLFEYDNSPLKRLMLENYGGNLTTYEYSAEFSTLPPEYTNDPEFLPFALTRVIDANGQESQTFSVSVNDALGRTILSISPEGGETYAKYDDFSRTTNIRNPIGESYSYSYNKAGLLASKSMPHTAPQLYWYDKKYRDVAMLSSSGALTTTKYDGFGRPTGKYLFPTGGGTMPNIQDLNYLDASSAYSNNNLFSKAVYEPGKTWTTSSTNFELTPENEIGNPITIDYQRDDIGRSYEVQTIYPLGITINSSIDFNDANLPKSSTDNYSGAVSKSILTRTEYNGVLRPFNNFLKIDGNAEKLVSRYFYNQEDQLAGKMLGNVNGNTFLQRVAYKYDENTLWMTHINSLEEADCQQDILPALCSFSAEYEIPCLSRTDCNMVSGIVINGTFHAFPSVIDLTSQRPNGSLDIMINQLLEQLGYLEASFTQSVESDFLCTFNFTLFNFPEDSFALQFTGRGSCNFSLNFEPGDCCYLNDGTISNDTPWYGVSTTNALYAQKMSYDHLDIERIDYAGDCYFGKSSYDFTYDLNHRLLFADHTLNGNNPIIDGYRTAYTYDPAGNILTLLRHGRIDDMTDPFTAEYDEIDNLTYEYNQQGELTSITDGASEAGQPFGFPIIRADYGYDGAGNIVADGIRNMQYNAFNLPSSIQSEETSLTDQDLVKLTYQSNGTLLKRVGTEDSRTYIGALELKDGLPESLQFGDGRVLLSSSSPRYQYKITDHLGNTVVFFEDKDDSGSIQDLPFDPVNSEVLQRELYYPFGHNLRGTNPIQPDPGYNYAYNGKEKIGGTGLYAYGFRYYDPLTARFTGVDPISDQFAFVSVYNYAENSPVKHIDLHGLQKIMFDVTWFDPGIRAATRGKSFEEIKAMRDEYAGHLERYGEAVTYGISAGAGMAWLGIRGLPAVGRYVFSNPATSLIATKTAGEFAIGLFDEAGQLQLPGGFDDAGRALKVGVSDFMERNMKRMGSKIGGKLGKSRDLPFEPSREGFQDALNTIESTLNTPSAVSELFENSNGNKVFDIFSETTGMTVRVGEDGTFNTLIPEATDQVKKVIKNE